MNLEESNDFIKRQNEKKRKKKTLMSLITICGIAIVAFIILIIYFSIMDSNQLKILINDKKTKFSNALFVEKDSELYISVKEISGMLGWKFVSGEYNEFSSEDEACYIQNKYEIVSFRNGNSTVKKYIVKNEMPQNERDKNPDILFYADAENDTMEQYRLDSELMYQNGSIYMPFKNISKILDVNVVVDGNKYKIYDLTYLYQVASNNLLASGNGIVVSNKYENARALAEGVIVGVDSSGKLGACLFANFNQAVLPFIYSDITYRQNNTQFYVKNKDGNVGLLDSTGKAIIDVKEYEEVEAFDETNNLFLVKNSDGYGIIKDNKIVIDPAYDYIGMEGFEEFNDHNTETPNLLQSRYIIVKEYEKYGLYDIENKYKKILKTNYSSLGYSVSKDEKKDDMESLLIIPKSAGIHGMVVENNGGYGVFDLDSLDMAIPCSYNKIYSKMRNGKRNYYFELNGKTKELESILEEMDIVVEEDEEEEEVDEEIEEEIDEEIDEEEEENVKTNNKKNNSREIEDDEEIDEEEEDDDDDDDKSTDSKKKISFKNLMGSSSDDDDEEEDDE